MRMKVNWHQQWSTQGKKTNKQQQQNNKKQKKHLTIATKMPFSFLSDSAGIGWQSI